MPEQPGFPEAAKCPDLFPASLKDKPASFSDCLLAITKRFRSFFRKMTLDAKPVWITGTVTGLSKYQEDRWYVDLRGPEDAYLKAVVNPKLPGIEGFQLCDILILEGHFAISRPNRLDQIQIQFEAIRSSTLPCKVDYRQRIGLKKPMPDKIERIGILTSPKGRAVSDFHAGFGAYLQRSVSIEVEEVHLGKSGSILTRIQEADAKGYDILVITRGGGVDLDLFNLPAMVDALRQCQSFTLSALGHADDDMIFDRNADMFCTTPTAAGNELQKHINISRKNQRNTVRSPNHSGVNEITYKPAPVPEIQREGGQSTSWISRLEEFNRALLRWASAIWKTTWIAMAILFCLTILLYLLQHCAIPAARMGKEVWDQVRAPKTKGISPEKRVPEKKSQGKDLKRSSP